MEENNGLRMTHTANLPSLSIKSQLTMPIDSNANIKQVLSVSTYLVDTQIEPSFNKAIVKGKLGVKAVYLDTDNMYNTVSDSVTFSETLSSDQITADCQISVVGSQFICNFDAEDRSLKVYIEGNVDTFCNLISSLNLLNQTGDELVCKKSSLQACSCVQQLNKNVGYSFDFDIDNKINKILSYDSKVVLDDCKCYDGYIVISGDILNTITYETNGDSGCCIKIFTNSTKFKSEVEAKNSDADCFADVCCAVDLANTQISPEITDSGTKFNFDYSIQVTGFVYKTINVDIINDIYSLDSEIVVINNKYTICKKSPFFKTSENVDSEITLADEISMDEIVGMVDCSASIVQHEVKSGHLILEGVISGNLIYLDENKEIRHLPTQVPYTISLKQDDAENICGVRVNIVPTNCKCKLKRGNTLILDYEVCICGSIYHQTEVELIENIKYGKPISYGDIAFQIYLAHPNENRWDLCKRLHVTDEQLSACNKDLPTAFAGGEKVIVYR